MADYRDVHEAGEEHYDAPRQKRDRTSEAMQPPMTPMIDVTFQLLLFFLLTMTFRMAEGMIPGALPQKGLGTPVEEEVIVEPIRVHVLPAGEFGTLVKYQMDGYDGVITDGNTLYQRLKERSEAVGLASPLIITPAPNVEWGYVVEVFNQATRCRFESVEFSPS